jgi:hypothetical protein
MAAQSPHVCCLGQSGRHLLGMSISHFDPLADLRTARALNPYAADKRHLGAGEFAELTRDKSYYQETQR